MRLRRLLALCLLPMTTLSGQSGSGSGIAHGPTYSADGRLLPPMGYREWIYLTSGLDMTYTPQAASVPGHSMSGHSIFDNVFVNPEAYRAFMQTGTWPDQTVLVTEARGAESNTSINKAGHSQGQQLMALEVHVKDASRAGWSFYEFDSDAPAKKIPVEESCYSCHRDHAAVDTTFVQFYPTLLPVAKQKGTLSPNYLRESAPHSLLSPDSPNLHKEKANAPEEIGGRASQAHNYQ